MISTVDSSGGGPEHAPAPAAGQKAGINPLDTANHFAVGGRSGKVFIWALPGAVNPVRLTKDEAINLAAWLVVIADGVDPNGPFKQADEQLLRLIEQIRNT